MQQALAAIYLAATDTAHWAQRPAEVGIALWLHDAIYDVRAPEDEARSADWSMAAFQSAGVGAEVITRVHALIMGTEHTAAHLAGDAALLVDIDLALFGTAPARFAEYVGQIRQEYA